MKNLLLRAAAKVYRRLELRKNFATDPLANIGFLNDGLLDRKENMNSKHHKDVINRIIYSYRAAKQEQKSISLAYQLGGAWKEDIKTRRSEYLNALDSGDSEGLSELLANFFRNDGVAGLWTHEYYKDILNAGDFRRRWFINSILSDYKTVIDFVDDFDVANLEIPSVGNPWGYIIKEILVLPTSCRHYYYASHVNNLLEDVESPVVGEVGGGFGGFAYFLLSANRSCKYINFDLPEVLPIAQYFLLKAFPDKQIYLYGEGGSQDISEATLSSYDTILVPNFVLPHVADRTTDLFINTNSLSEMDYCTIEEYIKQIARITKKYFFHENSDRPVLNTGGHTEVVSSQFPIPRDIFRRIYKSNSLWGGGSGRYREHLYQRKEA